MTKPAGSKREETRKRMVEAVCSSFKEHGYAGIGVDGIAKEAGVTSGAFYAHLGSKDKAFEIAVAEGLEEVKEVVPQFQKDFGAGWVSALVDYYFGDEHRDNLKGGCAMTSLTTEVIRTGPNIRNIYQEKMDEIATLFANGLSGGDEGDRRARAWSMLSIFIGGLNLARAMTDINIIKEITASSKAAVIKMAGQTSN